MHKCTVCLEAVADQDLVHLTATCNHEFCRPCLRAWFETSLTCPKCRGEVDEVDLTRITGHSIKAHRERIHDKQQHDENDPIEGGRVDEFTLTWLQENDARQCPRCRHWIVRCHGCNHIICRCGCKFDFNVALFARDWDGFSPPLWAAVTARNMLTAGAIMNHRVVDDAMQDWTWTLDQACTTGDFEAVKLLVYLSNCMAGDVQLALREAQCNGHTPISRACWAGHLDIVEWLLKRGFMATTAENEAFGHSSMASEAMANACRIGNYDRVRWMLILFPRLATAKYNGKTPLYYACQSGYLQIVERLLALGVKEDVRDLDYDKWTLQEAMALACGDGNLPQIRWMLRLFPELLHMEYNGHTPLWYALEGHQSAVVDYLLEHGAKHETTTKAWTPANSFKYSNATNLPVNSV